MFFFFPLRGSMPKGEEKRAGSNSVGQWQRENMFRATFSKFLENNRDIGLSSMNTVTAGFLFFGHDLAVFVQRCMSYLQDVLQGAVR